MDPSIDNADVDAIGAPGAWSARRPYPSREGPIKVKFNGPWDITGFVWPKVAGSHTNRCKSAALRNETPMLQHSAFPDTILAHFYCDDINC